MHSVCSCESGSTGTPQPFDVSNKEADEAWEKFLLWHLPGRPFTLWLNMSEIEEAFIVMPLSCSSFLLSRYLSLPTDFLWIMLLTEISESDSVVLPE